MMHRYDGLYLFLLFAIPLACHSEELPRDEKLISTFQIVRFPNEPCVGTGTRNGTCYTSAECSDKGGTSSGSCADGFGVCCSFLISTCDQSSSENITYWTQASTVAAGSCSLSVCPVSDDICRLRLDFTNFAITGPSTITTSQVRRKLGQPLSNLADATAIDLASSWGTNCLLDIFSAQGASPSSSPPSVCGTLTGTHMYVEADEDRCNLLQFNLADGALTTITDIAARGLTALVTARTWDITVTQIECTNVNMPPVGCTQYFWGSATNTVSSYNWATVSGTAFTGIHLANQHQRICIRRERGMCIGCFYGGDDDFRVSGDPGVTANLTYAGGCGGYATPGCGAGTTDALLGTCGTAAAAETLFGWDMVVIPGAFGPADAAIIAGNPDTAQTTADIQATLKATGLYPVPWPPQICGSGKGLGIGSTTLVIAADWLDLDGIGINLTVCSRHTPFTIEFMSDDQEGQGATAGDAEFADAIQKANNGFNLKHTQIACT